MSFPLTESGETGHLTQSYLYSDVKTEVNYSLSSFRFLGIRYQATVST